MFSIIDFYFTYRVCLQYVSDQVFADFYASCLLITMLLLRPTFETFTKAMLNFTVVLSYIQLIIDSRRFLRVNEGIQLLIVTVYCFIRYRYKVV